MLSGKFAGQHQKHGKIHLYQLISDTYLMDKYQIFLADFLPGSAYSEKDGLKVFSKNLGT
jgi:hypothetical protein